MSIKKEADIQVEAYRVEAQRDYEKKLAAVSIIIRNIQCLTFDDLQKEKEINEKALQEAQDNPTMTVEQAKTDFFNNKDAVIQELIKHVMFVDCEIPRTLKGDFSELK